MVPVWYEKVKPHLAALGKVIPRPVEWIKNLISKDGDQRVHAVCALVACGALALATLALVCGAVFYERHVAAELVETVGGLTIFAGVTYNRGKKSEDLGRKPGG